MSSDGPSSDVCDICGSRNDLRDIEVSRTKVPLWVWLLLPLGVIVAAIAALVVQVKHTFDITACGRCRTRRRFGQVVSWLSLVVSIVLLFAAVILGVAAKSWLVFLGLIAVVVSIAYGAGRYDDSLLPTFVEYSKTAIVIDVPTRGPVTLWSVDDDSSV